MSKVHLHSLTVLFVLHNMLLSSTISLAAFATTVSAAVTRRDDIVVSHPPYCDSGIVNPVWFPDCGSTRKVHISEYRVDCTKRGCYTGAYINAADQYAGGVSGFNVICNARHAQAGSWTRCDNDSDDSRVYIKLAGSPQLPYNTIWVSHLAKTVRDNKTTYTNFTMRAYENVWESQEDPLTVWLQEGKCHDPTGKSPYCTSGPISMDP